MSKREVKQGRAISARYGSKRERRGGERGGGERERAIGKGKNWSGGGGVQPRLQKLEREISFSARGEDDRLCEHATRDLKVEEKRRRSSTSRRRKTTQSQRRTPRSSGHEGVGCQMVSHDNNSSVKGATYELHTKGMLEKSLHCYRDELGDGPDGPLISNVQLKGEMVQKNGGSGLNSGSRRSQVGAVPQAHGAEGDDLHNGLQGHPELRRPSPMWTSTRGTCCLAEQLNRGCFIL